MLRQYGSEVALSAAYVGRAQPSNSFSDEPVIEGKELGSDQRGGLEARPRQRGQPHVTRPACAATGGDHGQNGVVIGLMEVPIGQDQRRS